MFVTGWMERKGKGENSCFRHEYGNGGPDDGYVMLVGANIVRVRRADSYERCLSVVLALVGRPEFICFVAFSFDSYFIEICGVHVFLV